MTHRNCAAVYVHLFVIDVECLHETQDNRGERLVYFEQIDVIHRPADAFEQALDGADGSRRKPARLLCECRVPDDTGARRQAE